MQRGRFCGQRLGHKTHHRSVESCMYRKAGRPIKHTSIKRGKAPELPAGLIPSAASSALIRYAASGLFLPGDTVLPELMRKLTR